MKASVALGIVLALDTPKRKKGSRWAKKLYFCRRELGHTRLLRELRDDEPRITGISSEWTPNLTTNF